MFEDVRNGAFRGNGERFRVDASPGSQVNRYLVSFTNPYLLDRPIALICARGNRSTHAQRILRNAGFTRVYNIREGMFGSRDGPGWLSQTLPTEPCRTC